MATAETYKPAVTKNILRLIAGLVWIGVGTMLLVLAFSWLAQAPGLHSRALAGGGIALALLAHHFGFLRIVDRNLGRINAMEGKRCLFSFVPLRSYLLIAVMLVLGATLRHSAIPKPYLAVLYIGVGLALVLSSVRYMRVFCAQIAKEG